MKKGLTELIFILDRSGSMFDLASDTIGGFNSMLYKQKKVSMMFLFPLFCSIMKSKSSTIA